MGKEAGKRTVGHKGFVHGHDHIQRVSFDHCRRPGNAADAPEEQANEGKVEGHHRSRDET